jgi:hypothetical protein
MPAPPSPPTRTVDGPYHFHTYDYSGSADAGPFELSPAQPNRGLLQFYSLVEDLNGLYELGLYEDEDEGIKKVPNIDLKAVGARIAPPVPGEPSRWTMALLFGNAANDPNAPTVVITGGIHAREWIAPEMAYLLAEYLIMHYKAGPGNQYQRTIRDLVDTRRICIIPMLNPHGNYYTVFGQDQISDPRLWRKNRRELPTTAADWVAALTNQDGPNEPFSNVVLPPPPSSPWKRARYDYPTYDPVHRIPPEDPAYESSELSNIATGVDLNRNFDTTAWGYECTPDGGMPNHNPDSETYFGPDRNSEAETLNVADAMSRVGNPWLATAIDYHSYGQLILYPSETLYNGAVSTDYQALGKTLRQLVRSQAARDYRLGSSLKLIHYDGTGSVADYSAQRYHARAFTIELDPPLGDPAGFQLPEDLIRTVFEKNIRGALAAIAAPRPAGPSWSSTRSRSKQISVAARQFLDWDVYGRGNQLPALQMGERACHRLR